MRAPRLQVLHVIDSLRLGGAEQLLATLAENIDASSFDMRVCSLSPIEEQGPIPIRLRRRAIPVYTPSGGRRHDPRHVPWLAGVIRRERMDLVHSHLPYGNVIGLLAARFARRPAVSTIHSVQDRHRSLASLKERLQGRMLRQHASVVIACSSEVGLTTHERFRIATRSIEVVPNGIDTAVFGARDSGRVAARRFELLGGRAGPLVLAVGSLGPAKSHETLVDAAARLLGRFPDLRVVIVGRDGDNGPRVRRHITTQRLEDHVVLPGEFSDIPTTLGAADLFVDSSLWHGLPLTVLEAMAAGVPVVATAVGEMPRLQQRGCLADVVSPGDPAALADAVAALLDDRRRAREVAASAQDYVRSRHGAGSWARQLEAVYTRTVDRPSRPSSATSA
jgi:glycosyltransferase involved in cell wall biosynthesis